MKITLLLFGVCLLSVLTGCHKPQTSEVIVTAEATIKATAFASITAKRPDVSLSDLEFSSLTIRANSKGEEEVLVVYDLPASAKTTTEGNKSTTTIKQFRVRMSLSGKVEAVHESTRSAIHDAAQSSKPMPNTALQPTPTAPSDSTEP